MTGPSDVSDAVHEAIKLLVERLGAAANLFIVAADPHAVDPEQSAWAVFYGHPATLAPLVEEGLERLLAEARRGALH